MDLQNAQTGDRLWTMLPGPSQDDLMRSGDDFLLVLNPFEVIYAKEHLGKGQGKYQEKYARCVILESGDAQTISEDRLHESRNGAIRQVIKEMNARIGEFTAAQRGYESMLVPGNMVGD